MTRGRAAAGLACALLGASSIGLAACGSPKRDECRALIAIVNATADRVDKAQASLLDPTGLKALADALDKSVTEADALKLTVPDLQKHQKTYAALTKDVAKAAREIAAAGEAHDRSKAEAASDAMEKLVASEPKLVGELNRTCLGGE